MTLKLIIGNKNYSSWSFRPWIAMKAAGIAFDEEVISLYDEGSREKILAHSPAGKVPILIDGDPRVWESLAILEYLGGEIPRRALWPSDPAARAHARAISTEMHAGFVALRSECGMNMRRPPAKRDAVGGREGEHRAHRRRSGPRRARAYGAGGPFLFGKFSARRRDVRAGRLALRAPTRSTSARRSPPTCRPMIALPAWQEWRRAALRETWVIPKFEYDWPQVKRLAGGCRMKLVIGNKNYSSWSMRPWIAMKAARHSVRGGPRAVRLAARQCRNSGSGSPPTRRPGWCRC